MHVLGTRNTGVDAMAACAPDAEDVLFLPVNCAAKSHLLIQACIAQMLPHLVTNMPATL